MKTTRVIIGKIGAVKIETLGFVGPTCIKHTEDLVERLNGVIKDEHKKPEYYGTDTNYETNSDGDAA